MELDERLPSFEAVPQPYSNFWAVSYSPAPCQGVEGSCEAESPSELYYLGMCIRLSNIYTRPLRNRSLRLLLPDAPTDRRALTGTSHRLVRPSPAHRIAELSPLRVYRGSRRLAEACGDHTTVCRVAEAFGAGLGTSKSPVAFPFNPT